MKQTIPQPDYVTKKDLQYALADYNSKLRNELNSILGKYHNENMNRFDDVMKRLDDLTVDNEVGAYQIKDARDDIRNLEKRVQKLEKS
jgi:type II secretory pathway component HofQ